MKKRSLKFLALGISAVMMMGALGACGSSKSDSPASYTCFIAAMRHSMLEAESMHKDYLTSLEAALADVKDQTA